MFRFLLIGCALAFVAGSASAQAISHEEAHRRAEALLKKMTVDEKVGQLNQSSGIVMPLRSAIRAISSGGALPSRCTCSSALGTIRRPFSSVGSDAR